MCERARNFRDTSENSLLTDIAEVKCKKDKTNKNEKSLFPSISSSSQKHWYRVDLFNFAVGETRSTYIQLNKEPKFESRKYKRCPNQLPVY